MDLNSSLKRLILQPPSVVEKLERTPFKLDNSRRALEVMVTSRVKQQKVSTIEQRQETSQKHIMHVSKGDVLSPVLQTNVVLAKDLSLHAIKVPPRQLRASNQVLGSISKSRIEKSSSFYALSNIGNPNNEIDQHKRPSSNSAHRIREQRGALKTLRAVRRQHSPRVNQFYQNSIDEGSAATVRLEEAARKTNLKVFRLPLKQQKSK